MSARVRRLDRFLTASVWAITVHTALNTRLLRRPRQDPASWPGPMSVLVPARNEAGRIRPCLDSIVAALPVDAEVLVLDDDSVDGTAEVAAAALAGIPRARVITGRSLPDGWLGKPHACQQLADAADPSSGVLVFVDADVILAPWALQGTLDMLRDSGFDVISPYPLQLADGIVPRLVQPLLQWSWLSFLPLRLAESSRRPSLTAANGQLLAVDRRAYLRAGGHAAVRASVIEDVALVRRIKTTGGRGGVANGTSLAQCRMYESGADLREGYAKSLAPALGSPAGAAAVMSVLAALYVLPVAQVFRRGHRLLGIAAYAGGVTGRVLSARATGAPTWPDAAAHPASVLTLCGLTADSWSRRLRGNGVRWKGRPIP